MMSLLVISLLSAALLFEIVYIIFRNPNISRINIIIYPFAIILTIKILYDSPTLLNIVKLSSLFAVLTAKIFLKNKIFEKPDYRYLLLLLATILIFLIN